MLLQELLEFLFLYGDRNGNLRYGKVQGPWTKH